jgi:hypothetical protein
MMTMKTLEIFNIRPIHPFGQLSMLLASKEWQLDLLISMAL